MLYSPVTGLSATICSAVLPFTRARKENHPFPAADGSLTKGGPANTPPPGAASPRAAMGTLDAAPAGLRAARAITKASGEAVARVRRVTTRDLTSNAGAR